MPRREIRTDAQGNRVQVNVFGPEDADDDGVIHLDVVGITVNGNGAATIQPKPRRS